MAWRLILFCVDAYMVYWHHKNGTLGTFPGKLMVFALMAITLSLVMSLVQMI